MTDPLFDHAFRRDIARLADAIEAQSKMTASIQWHVHAIVLHLTGDRAALTAFLMASEPTVTPAAAAPAPADFDGAQYAFDAMMGDPLAALGNLTAKPTAADPGDEDDDSNDGRPRIRWSKYDTRCRELARLRTDAKHRAKAAKTPEQRAAAIVERNQAKSEANKRHAVLRRLFYRDDVIDFVKGELIVYDGSRSFTWRSEHLQAPNYILTLPE
jgi:hypothetical protein